MSLATSGLGGAGAGAGMSMSAMAHGGPSAMATHQQTSSGGQAGAPPGTTAPPPNMAGMAADVLDKNQNLGWKAIKNLAEMPIVSVDLYGDSGEVAYFPPVADDEISGVAVKAVGKLGANGTSLVLKKDSDAAHKALRRLISKSKGYDAVFKDTLSNDKSADGGKDTIESPHLLLGERQVKFLNPATAKTYTIGKDLIHAIEEDETEGVTIRNGNLDGSTEALDNIFDRVTINLNLHSAKKTLSMLPEEAVGIVLAKAKSVVSKSFPQLKDKDDEEKYVDFPTAIALPAWGCNHYAIETLMDACDGTVVLYNRSVAALAGAFVPKIVTEEGTTGLKPPKLYSVIMDNFKAHQKKIEDAQKRKEPLPNTSYMPMVVMAGMTKDGIEISAIQIKTPNSDFGSAECHCPFGEFRVVSTVSYHHSTPVSIVNKALVELSDIVDEICPELEDDGGVAAVVTYGTIAKQLQLKDAMLKSLNGIKGDDVWNTTMNFMSTQEDIVATGTAVLAGISHNRIVPAIDDDGSRPALMVTNASPCAVGVTYSFHGGEKGTWTEPKVIFDYDRRVPAAYNVEFSAAECVALRKDATLLNDMEKLVEESEKWLKGKHNALREEAALDLSIKVVQRFERNGKWRDGGYHATPLTQGKDEDSEEDKEEDKKIAIENSILELTLDSVGFMSMTLSTDG